MGSSSFSQKEAKIKTENLGEAERLNTVVQSTLLDIKSSINLLLSDSVVSFSEVADMEIESLQNLLLIQMHDSSKRFQPKPSPHLLNVFSDDEELRLHWTKDSGVLPEYQKADHLICVTGDWMADTLLLRQLREVTVNAKDQLSINMKEGRALFSKELVEVIKKAYDLSGEQAAKNQMDVIHNIRVYDRGLAAYLVTEEKKKPYFTHALQVLLEHEVDTSALVSKLSEMVDRSLHCRQVQVKAFNVIVAYAYRLLTTKKRNQKHKATNADDVDVDLTDYKAALRRFFECVEDYIDDHKENAFKSAFQEPAKYYFHHRANREQWNEENVETHGINWYLAMLNATLAIHLPLLPAYWDNWTEVCVDFWVGLNDDCWEEFSKKEHFGLGYQGIASLKEKDRFFRNDRVPRGQFPVGYHPPIPKMFANDLVNPQGDKKYQKTCAVYLERFASFFSEDFFVSKSFNKLNSEEKPEHTGFRKACQTLYKEYRQQNQIVHEAEFLDYCFEDDMYTKLDIPRVSAFFAWLGVIKPSHTTPITVRIDALAPHLERTGSSEDANTLQLAEIDRALKEATGRRDVKEVKNQMALRSEVMKKIKEAREAKINPMEFEIESSDKVKLPSSPTMPCQGIKTKTQTRDNHKKKDAKAETRQDKIIQDKGQDNKQHTQYKKTHKITQDDNNTR